MAGALDVAIIGAGHNGLTTAAYLGRRGLKVKVFEARHVIGGAAVTEEFYPGYRNSSCSYLVGMLSPKVVGELNLVRHGLKVVRRPTSSFSPLPDGRYLSHTHDPADFHRQLEDLCPGDGDAYARYSTDLSEVVHTVRSIMERRAPNLTGDAGSLLAALASGLDARRLSPRARSTLTRMMTASAGNVLDRYFKGDAVKGMFGCTSLVGSFQGPYTQGSAYVLLHHQIGEINGEAGAWGHAIGGMGAVSQSIANAGQAAGVEIEVSSPVDKILTRGGSASGIVLSDGREIEAGIVVANVTPRRLYRGLLDPSLVPIDVLADIDNYRSGSGTLRINVALAELPDFKSLPGRGIGPQHTGSVLISPSLGYLDRAFTEAKAHGWSSKPFIEMWISSTLDSTLVPEGKHVASLFCQHVSPVLPGGRDWDDHRDEAADVAIQTITEYAPNFAASVIGRKVLTPKDLEREYGLTGGDIFHGALHLDQLFALRPAAGFADHRTPVPGVYLCGSGSHPGGGVTGMPGRNAAREILKDLRARRFRFKAQ